ncbi:MAG: tryptophan 7-halogenase, partial [Actinomycetota bacterium]
MAGMEQGSTERRANSDVLVLGGGMAGWATAKLLAERGWTVEVIDDPGVEPAGLGESLEFSAPPLLAALGVDPDELLAADEGFAKTNVFVEQMGAAEFEIWPPGWFRHPPLFGSHFTLHVERAAVDRRLRQGALDAGARLRCDRVIEVEQEATGSGVAITGVRLRSGPVRRARWYVDASGHRSRLLGRALDLEVRLLGDERVALHRRLAVRPGADVTRLLFSANRDRRMTWAWVLPIGSHR